ncbi:hypothetical protein ILUMI_18850 [Ignelater luminosus]|uniref:DDE-1 domain-containing protein n=1 Tax=Ignelater luminosus TaxID=2038154 RepID=A0A8K0G6G2_IGNLU|nr:hypothetical protein ILUMI_18850 [Ignelater luminosus]
MRRAPVLLDEIKLKLAERLKILEKWGFGISRSEVLQPISEYVAKNKLETPFKNNTPGENWENLYGDQWVADVGEDGPEKLVCAVSKKGWMETHIFHNYFEKFFLPAIGKKPVLVIYDGHSIHVDYKFIELAEENNITILKLLKDVFRDTKPEIVASGFRKAGIHPFNSDVIPQEKYDPASLERWENTNQADTSRGTISGKEAIRESINTAEDKIIARSKNENALVALERLILEKVKQSAPMKPVKRRRAAEGAEVITSEEALQRIRNSQERTSKVIKRNPPKKHKESFSSSNESIEEQLPSSSDSSDEDTVEVED